MRCSAPSKLNCPVSVPTTPLTLTPVRTVEPPYACGTHATAVADVHALLPHTSAMASEVVTVRLALPKLSPLIMILTPPLGTALAETVANVDGIKLGGQVEGAGVGRGVGVGVGEGVEATVIGATVTALTRGAAQAASACKSQTAAGKGAKQCSAPSKLNCPVSVPTALLTLTPVRIAEPSYACGAHATAVADVHALLLHTSAVASEAVTLALGLALKLPKLSPLIVTIPPPLGTALAETVLTTGPAHAPSVCKSQTAAGKGAVQHSAPSKLNCPVSVPTTPLTLTPVCIAEPPYACGAHATAVADVHALLPHTSAEASEAVTLALKLPKLSPLIATVPPPLGTVLAETVLTTGAAYTKKFLC